MILRRKSEQNFGKRVELQLYAGLDISFFDREVTAVARDLIGVSLCLNGIGGMIVETEAYALDDPASHSFSRQSFRNSAMFGPPARAYVYRSYGMHWCLNFVCRRGCAVLVRALEPRVGIDVMKARRQMIGRDLCAGPGRLTQALDVTSEHNGLDILSRPFELARGEPCKIAVGTRIGISKAVDKPWRFGCQGSLYLSRKFIATSPP